MHLIMQLQGFIYETFINNYTYNIIRLPARCADFVIRTCAIQLANNISYLFKHF